MTDWERFLITILRPLFSVFRQIIDFADKKVFKSLPEKSPSAERSALFELKFRLTFLTSGFSFHCNNLTRFLTVSNYFGFAEEAKFWKLAIWALDHHSPNEKKSKTSEG